MSGLALMARLSEAASWPLAIRSYESDPWGYLRRKLLECEQPLRAYKLALYESARAKLLDDLKQPFLPPPAVMDHKETFEKLLPLSDFADLAFMLDGGDPKQRRASVAELLGRAKPLTLFDLEPLPEARRGKAWNALVLETSRRLHLDKLAEILARGERSPRRLGMTARRVRRNLGEFLSVTRHELGMREDVTPFMLTRVEAAVAATLRFVTAA